MVCIVGRHGSICEYQPLNFEYTQERMRAVAVDTSALAYVMIGLVAVVEVFKNMAFCLYNTLVFVVTHTIGLISQIIELAESVFCCTACPIDDLCGDTACPIQHQLPIISVAFSPDDLLTFRTAARSATSSAQHAEVYVGQHRYQIWFDVSTEKVNIQDYNLPHNPILSLGITEGGQVTTIQLDGVDQNAFPESFAVAMYGCFQKAYEFSSTYEPTSTHISARVIRRGLIENPEYHLHRLGEMLVQSGEQPSFGAKFLKNDLTEEAGVDAGGLRRDFIGDLVKGLVTHSDSLQFRANPENRDVCMPFAPSDGRNGCLPALDGYAQDLYHKLGHLIMLSYLDHRNLVMGRRFEDALFKAALVVTLEEAGTQFANLSLATRLKMARQIFEARGSDLRAVEFLETTLDPERPISQVQWAAMIPWAEAADTWPGEDFVCDPQNQEHRQHIVRGLEDLIFQQVGEYLSPIHAIAQGMHRVQARWNRGIFMNADQFIEKVQGSLDRAAIARAINSRSAPLYVQERAQWLRDWILAPTTPTGEVSNFLKFATGSPSLAAGLQIEVHQQNAPYNPALVGHSCFNSIDIAPENCSYGAHNNHTRAEFVRAVRELSLTQAGEYSMA